MYFKRIEIRNVCRFADFSADLVRGSIGIVGPNGSGKSTFLNLLYAAVTGDFGRYPGIKADMPRNTAGQKAESYVRAVIEHAGVEIDVTRNFRPTKARPATVLLFDGAQVTTDANKAKDEIARVLGVDMKLLDLYAFKEQHTIYDFITSTTANLARAYQVLCRTGDCEAAWETVGEYLNKDKEANAPLVDDSDELMQRCGELQTRLDELKTLAADAIDRTCEDKFIRQYEARVQAHRRLESLRAAEKAAAAAAQLADEAAFEAAAAADNDAAAAAGLREKFDKRAAKATDTRAALKAFAAYKTYRARRKTLKDEADSLAAEAKTRELPVAPPDADKLEEYAKQAVLAEKALDDAKQVVRAFKNTGLTACPTCKTPVTHLEEHLDACRNLVDVLPTEIRALDDKVAAIEEYKSAAAAYGKWRAGYDARLVANVNARSALVDVEAPDGDEAELKEWLDKFVGLERDLDRADKAAASSAAARLMAEAARDAKRARLAEIEADITASTIDPAKLEKALRRLAEHAAAVAEAAGFEGEARGVQRALNQAKTDLKALREKAKRAKKVRTMVGVLTRVRDALHRDCLPRKVAAANLVRMEGAVNENLALFGDPFFVEAADDLSFVVHKPGEPPQPAALLSTGQRVVLALAFWPAVASLWAAELGILALDEPTANLDAANRGFLASALAAMTTKVRGHRQLLMVTHDHDLRTSFDQVLDLGG